MVVPSEKNAEIFDLVMENSDFKPSALQDSPSPREEDKTIDSTTNVDGAADNDNNGDNLEIHTEKDDVVNKNIGKCNTIIYSCLCGSHLESVQEGKGEIRYHFTQHGYYACQSLGNSVTIVFFQSLSESSGTIWNV
jgi:hypothetical protein